MPMPRTLKMPPTMTQRTRRLGTHIQAREVYLMVYIPAHEHTYTHTHTHKLHTHKGFYLVVEHKDKSFPVVSCQTKVPVEHLRIVYSSEYRWYPTPSSHSLAGFLFLFFYYRTKKDWTTTTGGANPKRASETLKKKRIRVRDPFFP